MVTFDLCYCRHVTFAWFDLFNTLHLPLAQKGLQLFFVYEGMGCSLHVQDFHGLLRDCLGLSLSFVYLQSY